MKRRHLYYAGLILLLLVLALLCLYPSTEVQLVQRGYHSAELAEGWDRTIAAAINEEGIAIRVDGTKNTAAEQPYMEENRQIMLPLDWLRDLFSCSVGVYEQSRLLLLRNTITVEASLSDSSVWINGEETRLPYAFTETDGNYYVSVELIQQALGYEEEWSRETNTLTLTSTDTSQNGLPATYDARDYQRTPAVMDQGSHNTCWAFASLNALESVLLPERAVEFSVDHMVYQNSFGLDPEAGGEYSMAMAYLLSWQGPVLEEEDPYGDGQTETGLDAVCHVQEIQMIPKKDFTAIKRAVYLYGGVHTSLYTMMVTAKDKDSCYNEETSAYCYIGTEKINHDVVIVGWDDTYSRSNFSVQPEGDGAFLCMNSWGEEFGDQGFFWVSYYDSNIGIYNLVYTGVEAPDNYDSIYQSDLCGWGGQLGYGSESAYFANLYTAREAELLEAVGFYAVGAGTSYEVYTVTGYETTTDLRFDQKAASGYLEYPGYYTISLPKPVALEQGERFAVIVYLRTPGDEHPIAVEYHSEGETGSQETLDGEGYISHLGAVWQSAEETQQCHVCLKAYTSVQEEP